MRTSQGKISPLRTIHEILSVIRELESVDKDTELAELLEVGPSTLSTWKKRGTIPYAVLLRYCEQHHLSLHWLLTGRGPARLGEPQGGKSKTPSFLLLQETGDKGKAILTAVQDLSMKYHADREAILEAILHLLRVLRK